MKRQAKNEKRAKKNSPSTPQNASKNNPNASVAKPLPQYSAFKQYPASNPCGLHLFVPVIPMHLSSPREFLVDFRRMANLSFSRGEGQLGEDGGKGGGGGRGMRNLPISGFSSLGRIFAMNSLLSSRFFIVILVLYIVVSNHHNPIQSNPNRIPNPSLSKTQKLKRNIKIQSPCLPQTQTQSQINTYTMYKRNNRTHVHLTASSLLHNS